MRTARATTRVSGPIAIALLLLGIGLGADFPKAQGPVNDFAELLSDAQEEQLRRLLGGIEAETSAEIALVTVPSLDGLPVEDYATRLFSLWGIGRAQLDNGVLILVAPNEREMRIEVGYGLEGVLPDGLAGDIIRTEFVPRFQVDDYPGGIVAGTTRVAEVVRRQHLLTPDERRAIDQANAEASLPPFWVIVPFLGLFVGIGGFAFGLGMGARAFVGVLAGLLFGGIPLLMALMATTRTGWWMIALIGLAALAYGLRKGQEPSWRKHIRGAAAGRKANGWVMGEGSSSRSGSSSSSSSSDSFGGGSSGGGGASGRW